MFSGDGAELIYEPCGKGRMVLAAPDGSIYCGRRYRVYRSADRGETWRFVTEMPSGLPRRLISSFRLGGRLLRQEVRALAVMSGGGLVAANRRGVYFADAGEPVMRPSRLELPRDASIAPPMTLTVGPSETIVWGEYKSAKNHGLPIRVYASTDRGRSFHIAWETRPGDIRHVHNMIFDPASGCYWLLAGDHGDEPGIGRLSTDFTSFEWVVKGQQRYRATDLFDLGDHFVYGTDTEKEANAVMSLEKKSGRVEKVCETDGSCIYSCRFGGIFALTTSVEPSEVNRGQYAGLWISRDGHEWRRVLQAKKDLWHPTYFQFGSLILPRGASQDDTIYFSGQALEGMDGRIYRAHVGKA